MLPPELHPCSMQHKSESNSPPAWLTKEFVPGSQRLFSSLPLANMHLYLRQNHSGVGSSPMCVGFRVEGMRPFDLRGRRGTALFRHAIIPVGLRFHTIASQPIDGATAITTASILTTRPPPAISTIAAASAISTPINIIANTDSVCNLARPPYNRNCKSREVLSQTP